MRLTHNFIRQTIADIQKMIGSGNVATRQPTSRRRRAPLLSSGPNEDWCCDGYDKLCKYGFAIWGVRDKFSRKWLGLWVLPSDRISDAVAYQWLSLVHRIGGKFLGHFQAQANPITLAGLPKQPSDDYDREEIMVYGLANALR